MFKTISVWNPWAALVVNGYKINEVRAWPAPASLIGQRIGIASTKTVKPDQRASFADPTFQRHYQATGLPGLDDLPHGYLLGSVVLHSCDQITREQMDDTTEEELAFGWYSVGRWAWRMCYPHLLPDPIPVHMPAFMRNADDQLLDVDFAKKPASKSQAGLPRPDLSTGGRRRLVTRRQIDNGLG
jgi:hypothetical protein